MHARSYEYCATKRNKTIPPWRGWGPILVLPVAILWLVPPAWPRWALMWMLAVAVYAGLKWLTWRRTPAVGIPWWQHAGYLLAWPGMDAKAFLSLQRLPTSERPAPREWLFAMSKLLFGVVLFWGARIIIPEDQEIVLGWSGMVGLMFLMHFGSFHLLSCAWRAIGMDARPLMNYPVAAVRVTEFWSKRWNIAFRDVTHRFLFRPLTKKLGPHGALAAGFLFSGLVHDFVISLPPTGGYGFPTLFFVIQAAALQVERSQMGQTVGLGEGWRGWLFTALVVLLPAYGLFHPPFIRKVIVPFMAAVGAA